MSTLSSTNNGSGGNKFISFIAIIAVAVVFLVIGYVGYTTGFGSNEEAEQGQSVGANTTGRGTFTEADVQLHTRDFTDDEWHKWMNEPASQFNVDVYIRTSHAAEHGAQEMNDALRCATQQGTVAVLSENFTRRLHLLCHDPESKNDYVIIIQKIKRSVDEFRNSTSELVTAFKLNPASTQGNIASYIYGEVNITQKAILVRLAFKAGELFFSPYK